eukprot:CAMPEP_0173456362 /NCGR_PEP_ID=MMETSP1357-20121228/55854_1 /TAXON_ID=77926 /ORGANISM="Hemiselmis rufescens, Strain PCC563" /LENGTH=56 /DNA_ID=CAMNT_0014423569 /DNA_START=235 /DNA_END=405 /DNA_ORIENTATION=-
MSCPLSRGTQPQTRICERRGRDPASRDKRGLPETSAGPAEPTQGAHRAAGAAQVTF